MQDEAEARDPQKRTQPAMKHISPVSCILLPGSDKIMAGPSIPAFWRHNYQGCQDTELPEGEYFTLSCCSLAKPYPLWVHYNQE